jgi:N-acyl homoserine lactone hydrolase
VRPPAVEQLHLADVVLPEGHPRAREACPVYAFLVRHPDGHVLVDTGVSDHPAIERAYRPERRPLADTLAALDLRPADVVALIDTHLHFDHAGENRLFPETPIFVQAPEYEASRGPRYTVPDAVDFPGARFELVNGEAEVLPGITLVPTPGHSPGHQSVLIESDEGRVLIAGQAAYTAAEFARAQCPNERDLAGQWDEEQYRASLRRLWELGAHRVYFSHDRTTWERTD